LTAAPVVVLGWTGVPIDFAFLYGFRRRQQAELKRLREIKRQLQGN
jgi:hypothetical protein